MLTNILPWILFLLVFLQASLRIINAQSDNTACSPFRLLVIWHTSNGEDAAFIEQRRLIIRLLLDIPEGTEVHVTAINTELHHLLYTEGNITIERMKNIILFKPEILRKHIIQDSLMNTVISSFMKQRNKKEIADKILLVVSEKTEIKKSWELIENVKLAVIFAGWNPPPAIWTSLTTDQHSLLTLNTTFDSANINNVADTALDLLCRDAGRHSRENTSESIKRKKYPIILFISFVFSVLLWYGIDN